jgi:hypothetical protein
MNQVCKTHFLTPLFASAVHPCPMPYARAMRLSLEEIQNEIKQLKFTEQLQLVRFLGNELTLQIPNLEQIFSNDHIMRLRSGDWTVTNSDIEPLFNVEEDGIFFHPLRLRDISWTMKRFEQQTKLKGKI